MCWTDERHQERYQDSIGIDGEPIEFEWKNFSIFSSLSILEKIQGDSETRRIQPEEFTDRTISMSMFNDIVWNASDEGCLSNDEKVKNYAMRFSQGHWTFLGPGSEEKWDGDSHDQKGQWNCTADKMVQQFKETGHTVLKSTSALESWSLEAKERKNLHSLHLRF